jgi:multicomponent Na+:H+ antiporter subunit G
METFLNLLAGVLMIGGVLFMLVGSIGINRLPDFYTRAHAAGKVDTLGIMMFLGGMVVFEGLSLSSAKLLLIIVFVAFTSPVAAHALARRALLFGLKPWYGDKNFKDKS